ncbi:MAG: hypothetical protein PF501_05470 [Salinisphaera sp.]|jgi:hypothetical protein|nr:hypothetical protein [Salinisphaera sp.]
MNRHDHLFVYRRPVVALERINFKSAARRLDIHECETDPDVRLYSKSEGQPDRLCTIRHGITDNR